MTQTNKSRPDADNTRTAQTDNTVAIIAASPERCKRM